MHFIFVRKLPCTKWTKIKCKRNILDLQYLLLIASTLSSFLLQDAVAPHRLLRQEAQAMRHLQHRSIISLVGVLLSPRLLVMEYAPLRSLRSMLRRKEHFSRNMHHRIALQVGLSGKILIQYISTFNPLSAKPSFQLWYPGGQRLKVNFFS